MTYAVAITRLEGGVISAFPAGSSTAQKLQIVNEAVERLWEFGTWAGLLNEISLTSTANIITLPSTSRRIDGLMDVTAEGNCGCRVQIKSQSWPYTPNGPGRPTNWDNWCGYVALDLGDNASGLRQYELTGNATVNDAKTFKALSRKRYVYISDTSALLIPDCFQALRIVIESMNFEYAGDFQKARSRFDEALQVVDQNLGQYYAQEEWLPVQIAPEQAIASTVWNAV